MQERLTGDTSKVGIVAYHKINGSFREKMLDICMYLEHSHLNKSASSSSLRGASQTTDNLW